MAFIFWALKSCTSHCLTCPDCNGLPGFGLLTWQANYHATMPSHNCNKLISTIIFHSHNSTIPGSCQLLEITFKIIHTLTTLQSLFTTLGANIEFFSFLQTLGSSRVKSKNNMKEHVSRRVKGLHWSITS